MPARLKDPVCGMTVTAGSAHFLQVKGKPVYFCSRECKGRFAARPARYQTATRAPVIAPTAPGADAQALYTCPMHPEIRKHKPGTCPKCGMTLELAAATLDDTTGPELADFQRRLFWTLPFSMLVMLLAMAGHGRAWFAPGIQSYIELTLALPVVLWAGAPVFQRAWQSVRRENPNMWTLIGLGTAAAFLYSVAATFAPGSFPAAFAASGGVAVYFVAATSIISLTLLGQIFELTARAKASEAIKSLLRLAPKTARRINPDASEEDVALAAVKVGDRLRVRPGEQVPVDGTVQEGSSALDESMLTGESVPAAKTPGDALIGATLNTSGALVMRADKVGAQTVLAGIVRMVASAQRSKAPLQRMADRVAAWFVGGVIAAALLCFFGWGLFGPQPSWGYGLINAVAVLIIACPCALGLATPMSIMVGSGVAATRGVLFRDAAAIENLRRVDTLIVDKTGTLTAGRPSLTRIIAAVGGTEDEVLRLAASLDQGSEHPLASAIVKAALARGLALAAVEQFESIAGMGVRGVLEGRQLALGNAALMLHRGVSIAALEAQAETLRTKGASVMYLAIDGKPAGLLALADPIKPGTAEALAALKAGGLSVIMASGDSLTTARAVGAELGLGDVRGGQKPADKLALVARLKEEGRVVAMVGDGINDAPALAAADVGIAMGSGSDVAMQSAQVTLVKGDLRGIAVARAISQATVANMRQNLAFAFVYNALGVPLAAGVLYPFTGWLPSPMLAALAMSLSSLSVIANALRLRASVGHRVGAAPKSAQP